MNPNKLRVMFLNILDNKKLKENNLKNKYLQNKKFLKFK